jgi:hypothetical protein
VLLTTLIEANGTKHGTNPIIDIPCQWYDFIRKNLGIEKVVLELDFLQLNNEQAGLRKFF